MKHASRVQGDHRSDRVIGKDGAAPSACLPSVWSMLEPRWRHDLGSQATRGINRLAKRVKEAYDCTNLRDSRWTESLLSLCFRLGTSLEPWSPGAIFFRQYKPGPWPYSNGRQEYWILGPSLVWALGGCPCSPWVSAGLLLE
jgi:hypothetical protein